MQFRYHSFPKSQKMIALKLFLVVSLVTTAIAETDLELAYRMSECLREAVVWGVPSVNIPSHNPFRLKHNVSWSGDIVVSSGNLNLTEIVMYGIPFWYVHLHQVESVEESQVVFQYQIKWPKLVVTSKYELETTVVLIPGKLNGDLNITLVDPVWQGVFNFTKPGFNKTQQLDYLEFEMKTERVQFDFTGLGTIDKAVSGALSGLLKAYIDAGKLNKPFGDALKAKLNNVWFPHSDSINKIIEFCQANEALSY